MTDTRIVSRNGQTDGYLRHTGQLTVSCKLDSGTLVTLTLPDDWQTLLARVAALEARVIPNSLEDLTYAG
jgi:hypothetical protein